MFKRIFDALNQPLGRIGVLIALFGLVSVGVWGIAQTQKAPPQPIQFPHGLHVGLGIQCLYCHPGALRGPSPGIPTETKCWGCHQQIPVQGTELTKLAAYVQNNQAINWVPVAQVPDFVHFVHRPHIAAGPELRDLSRRREQDDGVPKSPSHEHGLVPQLPSPEGTGQPGAVHQADRLRHLSLLNRLKGIIMTNSISRRDFLKLAGAGAATTAVLTGCGPASRYVTREPYTKMPEYTYNGLSTYYATTCRECSAGCGLVVRTMQGRAIKVEGNPNNPVNLGKTCARGQVTLQGLYNYDRIRNPGNTRAESTITRQAQAADTRRSPGSMRSTRWRTR